MRRVILSSIALLIAVAPLAILTKLWQSASEVERIAWHLRPLIAADAISFYIGKVLFPLQITLDYSRTHQWVMAHGRQLWTWIVPVGVAVGILVFRRNRPWLVAGALVMVAGVSPVLGFIPFDYQRFSTVVDRYLYIAMLGPALIVAGLIAEQAHRRAVGYAAILVAVLLGIRSILAAGEWQDDFTRWQTAVEANPDSWLAHSNFGNACLREGPQMTERAVGHFHRAIALNPDAQSARDSLATVLLSQGRFDEAIQPMIESMRSREKFGAPATPELIKAWNGLADLLLSRGRTDEAAVFYQRILAASPDSPEVAAKLQRCRRPVTRPTTSP